MIINEGKKVHFSLAKPTNNRLSHVNFSSCDIVERLVNLNSKQAHDHNKIRVLIRLLDH